jgi:hypothetical protein
VASAIRMRSLAGRLQWRRPGTIQASCQAPQRKKKPDISTLLATRQSVAGPSARVSCGLPNNCAAHNSCAETQAKGRIGRKSPAQLEFYQIDVAGFFMNLAHGTQLAFPFRSTKTAALPHWCRRWRLHPGSSTASRPSSARSSWRNPKASNSPSPRAQQASPHGQ